MYQTNIFIINFLKFLVLYLGCGCITFHLLTQMTLRHLLHMNKKLQCKDHQVYSKNVEKDLEKRTHISISSES